MMKYIIAKEGKEFGPFTKSEIVSKIQNHEHTWLDYVYDEVKKDWILLIEHNEFAEDFNKTFQKSMPTSQKAQVLNKQNKQNKTVDVDPIEKLKERAWYVLKDGQNYGPFSKLELVQMLQTRTLFEHDFVWHSSFDAWKRLAEVREFDPDNIKGLRDSELAEVNEMFFRRRHLRTNYGCSLIVHDNQTVYKGKTFEISAGGAGVQIDNKNFQVGQNVYLHFKPGVDLPPFNAICQIVSKQFVDPTQNTTQDLRYGVKFLNVNPKAKEAIESYTNKNVA